MRTKQEKKTCFVEGCENYSRCLGLCTKHHHRYIRYGDVNKVLLQRYAKDQTCGVDGCSLHPIARGMCSKHYRLHKKYGDPNKRRIHPKCKLSFCSNYTEGNGYCLYHNHLIRKSGMEGEFDEIFGSPPYICHICGKEHATWEAKEVELDHILSRKRGGQDHISNLKPACKRCNRIKNDMSLNELLEFCQRVVTYQDSLDHEKPT